jgi:hypothetical protein
VLRSSPRFARTVALLFGALVLGALVHRFRFGTELSDEAFSIALPYRFALGDRPFIDEVNTAQTAGILLLPFVWLFVKLTGGTSGIVLFVRMVHLFVKGIAALSVHSTVRRWMSPPSAIAVSFVPFAFVPHSIPNVGYNVLCTTLLVVGSFASAGGIALPDRSARSKRLVLAGLAYGLATFAYPPIAPTAVVAAALVVGLCPQERLRAGAAFVLGGVLSVALLLPFLLPAGATGILRSFHFGAELVHRPPGKLKLIIEAIWTAAPKLLVGVPAALAVVGLLRRRSLIALVVPIAVVVAVLWTRDEATSSVGSMRVVIYTGVLAPALLFTIRRSDRAVRGALLIYVPSVVAGLATAFASSNGTDNAALGLESASVLFAALAVVALERAYAERLWTLIPPVVLSLVLVQRSYDFVYRDAPIEQLTTLVRSGPFRGIWTTAEHAALFRDLEEIMRKYDRPGGRVLVIYESPGSYLFSSMRPSSNTVWPLSYFGQPELLAYWKKHVTGIGIVVEVGPPQANIVDATVAVPARLFEQRGVFYVYAEP